jgi:large subunit ribosomal protein L18
MSNSSYTARDRKRKKIRAKISGTSSRPRLSVFKSNTAMYAQLINDEMGVTLTAASGKGASEVGSLIAKQSLALGVKAIVFDRGGYLYAGKVKALAEAARKEGLDF